MAAALERHHADPTDREDLRLLTKHYLALLQQRAPGNSVEVRVPPYAAVQVVPGVRHTRGTPPAVVELDAATWIALATGDLAWDVARADGRLRASGERTDLTPYLPLRSSWASGAVESGLRPGSTRNEARRRHTQRTRVRIMNIDELRSRIQDVLPGIRRDLEDLVRIQSVSADPERAGEVQRSAEAVSALFEAEGFDVQITTPTAAPRP